MSRKATGSTFIAPDEPVKSFSPEMQSCYECLHRVVYRSMSIPNSVDSIVGIVRQLKGHYYPMRDYLEADSGISRQVSEALPEPEITDLLKTLFSWEENPEVGKAEFDKRDVQLTAVPLHTDPAERFLHWSDCWKQYRLWMFEAGRILRVSRKRIAADAPSSELRRYPWI